jgi:cell division protein FtsI (penicillin-binding protein 3)
MRTTDTYRAPDLRYLFVLAMFFIAVCALVGRAVYLQVWNSEFLQKQGDSRHLRVVQENAVRGMILDRNGVPLAISTPVDSVWAQPQLLSKERKHWSRLTKVLKISRNELSRSLRKYSGREFMYLRRHVTPAIARKVKKMEVPGVHLQREYRRYYPAGSVTGHIVGFTDIDDRGQEGIEHVYEPLLQAIPGKTKVLKDRLGHIVERVESISLPTPGRDIVVSIDQRIQYLAYRELKAAVRNNRARAGSVIVLDAQTGEILAMVNEPGFNPNNRLNLRSRLFRNRAVTDVVEPGSTLKPFTIATALESRRFSPRSRIDTSPGYLQVGHKTIRDTHNYGLLTVAGVLKKSSNVGATKIAFAMDKEQLWDVLTGSGFGQMTGSQLPGESAGIFHPPSRWVKIDYASLSYGYGISVTPLQLARAYTVFANDGLLVPVTVLKQHEQVKFQRVLSAKTARQVRDMLEAAVGVDGTGASAQVQHYRVAGKTGTVHKMMYGEYSDDNYVALFAGMVPATRPRLIMVVTIDDPKGEKYYGGQVAAPVFSKVMAGAMRLLNISPDAPESTQPVFMQARSGSST